MWCSRGGYCQHQLIREDKAAFGCQSVCCFVVYSGTERRLGWPVADKKHTHISALLHQN